MTCKHWNRHVVIWTKIRQNDGISVSVNIRMLSYLYRNRHDKDKTVWLSSYLYLYHGNHFTWKDGLYIAIGPKGPLWSPSMASYTTWLPGSCNSNATGIKRDERWWKLRGLFIRSREISRKVAKLVIQIITLKLDMPLGSSAAKFLNERIFLNTNLAASRLCEILR